MPLTALIRFGRHSLGALVGVLFIAALPACSSCRHPKRVDVAVDAGPASTAATGAPTPAASCDTPVNPSPLPQNAVHPESPEQIARRNAQAEQMATALQAKRQEICTKLISDFLAGKPTPTKPIPLDATHEFMPDPIQWQEYTKLLGETSLCRAILNDDPALCDTVDEKAKEHCQVEAARFHELRHAPKGNKWRHLDIEEAQCVDGARSSGKEQLCSDFSEAVRRSDPSRCPTLNVEGLNECPALATLDPVRCPSGKKHDRCVARVKQFKLLASGGLKALAKNGTDTDKQLARAALGDKTACDVSSQFMPICANSDMNLKIVPVDPAATPSGK